MTSLLERIGNRTVLVDACVSPRLAKALRKAGLSVRHMNEINPRMPDAHIEILVLEPNDVLITHDRMFARFLGPRKAILLGQHATMKNRKEDLYEEVARGCSLAEGSFRVAVPVFLFFSYCLFKMQVVKIHDRLIMFSK
jgi:hypothetical protein